MQPKDLKAAYRTIIDDPFPADLEIRFGTGTDRQTLVYEKVVWKIGNEIRGLRYGENLEGRAKFVNPLHRAVKKRAVGCNPLHQRARAIIGVKIRQ